MGLRKKSYLKMMRLFLFLIELPSTQKLEDKWEILDGLKGEGLFEVLDTQVGQGCYLHIGKQISGSMQSGQTIRAEVDTKTRESTRSNHSATHLVHAALSIDLGESCGAERFLC